MTGSWNFILSTSKNKLNICENNFLLILGQSLFYESIWISPICEDFAFNYAQVLLSRHSQIAFVLVHFYDEILTEFWILQ